MTPERLQRVDTTLAQRQSSITVLLEQVHKPHNLAAIIRTCDSVGIQDVHAVRPEGGIPRLNHTSQGAQNWVSLTTHDSLPRAVGHLRERGMKLYAAHLSDKAVDFRSVDYTRPCAVVMGTEKDGISAEALDHVDAEITIPMHGMTRSLNVSVACAVILYEAQRQRQAAGLYERTELQQDHLAWLRFRWLHPQVAAYCDRHELAYPRLDESGDMIEPVPVRPSPS